MTQREGSGSRARAGLRMLQSEAEQWLQEVLQQGGCLRACGTASATVGAAFAAAPGAGSAAGGVAGSLRPMGKVRLERARTHDQRGLCADLFPAGPALGAGGAPACACSICWRVGAGRWARSVAWRHRCGRGCGISTWTGTTARTVADFHARPLRQQTARVISDQVQAPQPWRLVLAQPLLVPGRRGKAPSATPAGTATHPAAPICPVHIHESAQNSRSGGSTSSPSGYACTQNQLCRQRFQGSAAVEQIV